MKGKALRNPAAKSLKDCASARREAMIEQRFF
jgi:hypothetical protein